MRVIHGADATPGAAGAPRRCCVAGASALREYENRRARRDARIRSRHPRLGGPVLALGEAPQHQRAWATGANGERLVGRKLDELAGQDLRVLHDRRMRDENGRLLRSNLDHLLIAPSGVWVVDAKSYRGTLQIRRSGGLFRPRVESLWIAGRNRSTLLDGVLRQALAVRRELEVVRAGVPVHGAMCFVGTELPWFGTISIAGVAIVGRSGLATLVRRQGDLDGEDRANLAEYLAGRFPAA